QLLSYTSGLFMSFPPKNVQSQEKRISKNTCKCPVMHYEEEGVTSIPGYSLFFRSMRYQPACGVHGLGIIPLLVSRNVHWRFGVPYSASRPKSLTVDPRMSLPKVSLQFAPWPDWAKKG